MRITIVRRSRRRVDVSLLRARASRLLKRLRTPSSSELNVILESDPAVRRLHRRYFGLNTKTNVISFGQWEGDPARVRDQWSGRTANLPLPLGDVVISVDRAKAEADAAGMSLDTRVAQLLIHGVLHLLGHEHERGGKSARSMEQEESRLAIIALKRL